MAVAVMKDDACKGNAGLGMQKRAGCCVLRMVDRQLGSRARSLGLGLGGAEILAKKFLCRLKGRGILRSVRTRRWKSQEKGSSGGHRADICCTCVA
jgi:hypothetical protein